MKKKRLIICILVLLLFVNTQGVHALNFEGNKRASNYNNEESTVLYTDLLKSLLFPYINDAIANYYSSYEVTSFMGSDMKFLDIKRLEKLGQYYFEFIIEIHTFQGAHNPPYATDIITFRDDFSGIHAVDYKHYPNG
ncbi:MAG: DUF3888 domain-containing protein [Clostridiales bacterium]|jgi:hypothetical protein|nr:DUF3888 domain-containing protein [Clostridiales bacterium]